MNAIQRKRLLKLADFLAGPVAKADKEARKKGRYKFEMSSWCGWNTDDDYGMHGYREPSNVGLSKDKCNTSACALGWATVAFPRQFKLKDGYVIKKHSQGEEAEPWRCSEDFFGLTYEQASEAFYYGIKRTAKGEAAFLRKLARG